MMFIRFEIISGRLVLLVMKFVVMMKVRVVVGLKCRVSSIDIMMGVRISVVLLLVNSVEIVVLSSM